MNILHATCSLYKLHLLFIVVPNITTFPTVLKSVYMALNNHTIKLFFTVTVHW